MEVYRRQIEELESHLAAISPEAETSSQSKWILDSDHLSERVIIIVSGGNKLHLGVNIN